MLRSNCRSAKVINQPGNNPRHKTKKYESKSNIKSAICCHKAVYNEKRHLSVSVYLGILGVLCRQAFKSKIQAVQKPMELYKKQKEYLIICKLMYIIVKFI